MRQGSVLLLQLSIGPPPFLGGPPLLRQLPHDCIYAHNGLLHRALFQEVQVIGAVGYLYIQPCDERLRHCGHTLRAARWHKRGLSWAQLHHAWLYLRPPHQRLHQVEMLPHNLDAALQFNDLSNHLHIELIAVQGEGN